MKTDSIFYQLFQQLPSSFFDLLNLPSETVNQYQFGSVEVKQLAFRLDGVFLPDSSEPPLYFVEVQFQKDSKFYSRFFSEIFLYLYQTNLSNDWRGVVIYPNREIESTNTLRYRELLNSGRVARYYLNEISETDSLGLGILKLIVAEPEIALDQGRELIERVRSDESASVMPPSVLKLIETILVYKLPQLTRQEIEAMFSISDLKNTKVYQEALEEGREEGREQGRREAQLQTKLSLIPKLVGLGLTPEQISSTLELDIEEVERAANETN